MDRLTTEHDKYHLHKILGFGCLFHYNLRIYYKFMYGTMFFTPNSLITNITPFVHLGLSFSSFIFHVPKYRYDSKIIIWKELQLHNIIFVSRSASMMLFSLFITNTSRINYIYKLLIIMGHHLLADYVSAKFINNNKTTTRDITDYENKYYNYIIKKFYAISQTFALSALLLNDNNITDHIGLYENSFLIMYPIQLSTFLMTLVRKQIISNNTWHLLYSMSLLYPYIFNFMNPTINDKYLLKISLGLLYSYSRICLRLNKYFCMTAITLNYYTNL